MRCEVRKNVPDLLSNSQQQQKDRQTSCVPALQEKSGQVHHAVKTFTATKRTRWWFITFVRCFKKKNFGQILRVRMRVGLGCARRRPRRRVGFDSFVTYKVPLSTPQRLWIISSLHVFWHLRRCCEVEHKILNLLFNTFVCVLLKGDLPQSNA